MPKHMIYKRIITASIPNNIVIKAYNKALEITGFDLEKPENIDIKNKLAVGAKVPNPGFAANLIRKTHLGFASTYELPPVSLSMKEWSFGLLGSLEDKLIQELAISRLKHDGNQDPTADEKHHYILETTRQIANEEIDNHYILIYEFLKRIAAVALSDDFMKDKVLEQIHEDKYVVLLQNFINQLMINREDAALLFSGQNMFAFFHKSNISSYAQFLKREVVARWGQSINTMIFNQMNYERPKHTFDRASTLIKGMQITMRGHLLVYLNELSILILKKKLITDAVSIDVQVVDKVFESSIDLLVSFRPTAIANETALISRDEMKIDSMEQSFKIVMEVFNAELSKKANEIQVKYSLMIKQLRAYFELDVQLMLINESLGQFSYVSELGGWIPIMLDLISPENLGKIMENFLQNASEQDQVEPMETSQEFQLALLALPNKEWVALKNAVVAIKALGDKYMIEDIRERFQAHFNRLNTVQVKLINYRLLEATERLISPIAQPLLTVDYTIASGSDASLILTPNSGPRRLKEDSPEQGESSHAVILRPRQTQTRRKSFSSSSNSQNHSQSSHTRSSYNHQANPQSTEVSPRDQRIQKSLTFLTELEQQNRHNGSTSTAAQPSQSALPSRSTRYDA